MPPKRTVSLGGLFLLRRKRLATMPGPGVSRVVRGETSNGRASRLAASIRSRPALTTTQGSPAMACDYLLYVSAQVSPPGDEQAEAPQSVFAHWRSAEAWYRDDLSDTRWPCGLPGTVTVARTSPRRDVAVVSLLFHWFLLPCPCATLACLGKRSRLCRRATDEEYPGRRRTKGAGRRGQPPPAPSFASGASAGLRPPCHTYLADLRPSPPGPVGSSLSRANPPAVPRRVARHAPGISTAR